MRLDSIFNQTPQSPIKSCIYFTIVKYQHISLHHIKTDNIVKDAESATKARGKRLKEITAMPQINSITEGDSSRHNKWVNPKSCEPHHSLASVA